MTGPDSAPSAGPAPAGPGPKVGPGSGPGPDVGSGPGSGSGSGPGFGPGSGSGFGPGSSPGPDPGSSPGSGSGRTFGPGDRRVRWLLPLLGAALFLSGCAYYNTFYYAKRYYNLAERSVQASASDKLPPDAVQKYDNAIKQAAKVIKFHSGSRWVDDALYLMGAAYCGKRDYEEGLRKFDELTANFPKSKWVPWALYRSGLAHFERKNYEQMDTYFARVLESYPEFERRDDILFTQARAAELRRDRKEAVRRFRELVDRYPKSPRAPESLLRIGDLYFDGGFADSAFTSYAEMGRLARDDETWRKAQLKAADALVRMGRADESVAMLRELLPEDALASVASQGRPTELWPAEIYVGLSRALNANEQPLQALEALRIVTSLYPTSSYAAEAQFQIGYTYEAYLDSLESARAAYDQVARLGANSVFREQAQQRSRNLQQLQTLSTQAVSDSASGADAAAEAQLRIAELQLFSQNKVAEAREKYQGILTEHPESRYAPRAAYALAWIQLRREEGQRDSALAAFREIVYRHPEAPAARGAIDLLAAEGADTTGLHALLVEVRADTTVPVVEPAAAGADTAASSSPVLPDSLQPPGGNGRGVVRGEAPGSPSQRATAPGGPRDRGRGPVRNSAGPGGAAADTSAADPGGNGRPGRRATTPADTVRAPAGASAAPADTVPIPRDTLRTAPRPPVRERGARPQGPDGTGSPAGAVTPPAGTSSVPADTTSSPAGASSAPADTTSSPADTIAPRDASGAPVDTTSSPADTTRPAEEEE